MLSIIPKISFYPDDGTVHVSFERPSGFGPFAWRLVDGGVLLRRETLGAEGEYFLPFVFPEGWMDFSLSIRDSSHPRSWHAQVGSFRSEQMLPEGWLGRGGVPFNDILWRYIHPSERKGAPAELQVAGSPGRMVHDGFRHFTIAPAFPGDFSARLLPDDGWLLLESPGQRPVCVDLLVPPEDGCSVDFFRGAHFKKGITEILMGGMGDPYHGQTPDFSTLLEFPDGWDDARQRELYSWTEKGWKHPYGPDY